MNLILPLQFLIETGGPVVAVIMVVALLLWILLFERIWLIGIQQAGFSKDAIIHWHQRSDHHTQRAGWIRQQIISENRQRMESTLPIIIGLIATLPLLGLFGTVFGMVHIFDQVALNGSPEHMADGIARATLPTLAGMLTSISGLAGYAAVRAAIAPMIIKLTKDLDQ